MREHLSLYFTLSSLSFSLFTCYCDAIILDIDTWFFSMQTTGLAYDVSAEQSLDANSFTKSKENLNQ